MHRISFLHLERRFSENPTLFGFKTAVDSSRQIAHKLLGATGALSALDLSMHIAS